MQRRLTPDRTGRAAGALPGWWTRPPTGGGFGVHRGQAPRQQRCTPASVPHSWGDRRKHRPLTPGLVVPPHRRAVRPKRRHHMAGTDKGRVGLAERAKTGRVRLRPTPSGSPRARARASRQLQDGHSACARRVRAILGGRLGRSWNHWAL